jgi:lipopolysaccharide transport system permease protein
MPGRTNDEVVIRPASGVPALDLGEIWRYRSLLGILVWRDILLRYKQTAVGVLWAVLQPLLSTVILTIVFGRLVGFRDERAPYHLVVLTGMLPWQLFATAVSNASQSVLSSGHMIGKVYFPRLIIPLSAVMSALLDFAVGFLVLVVLLTYNGVVLSIRSLTIPAIAVWLLLAALGASLWLAGLSVRFRDVRHVVPFLLNLGLYASPVAFSLAVVPATYRGFYSLNPVVAPIECFRWAVLGDAFQPGPGAIALSLLSVAGLLVGGAYFFRARELEFADLI